MQIRSFSVNAFQVNCYVLYHQGEALIVDPGGPAETVLAFLEEKKLKVVAIGNTHGHADHIAGNAWFRDKTGAPLFIHELDAPYLADPALHLGAQVGLQVPPSEPQCLLGEGDRIELGGEHLQVLHTPGHSRGGISLYGQGLLISGDTLFRESVGRWDFPGSDGKVLQESLRRLIQLPSETVVYPGHGPSTTIGHELEKNPFLHSLKDVE